jgi:hypothetical protein
MKWYGSLLPDFPRNHRYGVGLKPMATFIYTKPVAAFIDAAARADGINRSV